MTRRAFMFLACALLLIGSAFGILSNSLSNANVARVAILNDEVIVFDYYVASTGSDANPGTVAEPFLTVQHAVDTAASGETIGLRGGDTFTENVLIAAPVTLGSYGTGMGIIDGEADSAIKVMDTGDVVIRGIKAMTDVLAYAAAEEELYTIFITTTTNTATRFGGLVVEDCEVVGGNRGIYALVDTNTTGGFDEIRIVGNEVHESRDFGILLNGLTGGSITRGTHRNPYLAFNEVYNVRGSATNASGSGLAASGCRGTLIERNLIHDNGSEGNHSNGPCAIIMTYTEAGTIQFNECYNQEGATDGHGIDLDFGCENCIVQGNYSHDNKGYGFKSYAEANTYRFNVAETNLGGGIQGSMFTLIHNNTVVCTGNARGISSATDAKIYNNIVITATGEQFYSSPGPSYYEGNSYYQTVDSANINVSNGGIAYTTLASWIANGQEQINGGYQQNPSFSATPGTNASATLPGGSPLLDGGIDMIAEFGRHPGYLDMSGNVAESTSAPVVGAVNPVQSLAAWSKRRQLTIPAAQVESGIVSHYSPPLKVTATSANADGSDLRVALNADGTGLRTVDVLQAVGSGVFWIRVGPVDLSAHEDTHFYLFSGNAGAGAQNGGLAYDDYWFAYYPGAVADRTFRELDLTAMNTPGSTTGIRGDNSTFSLNGTDEYLTRGGVTPPSNIAFFMAWAKGPSGDNGTVLGIGKSTNDSTWSRLCANLNALTVETNSASGSYQFVLNSNPISTNTWFHQFGGFMGSLTQATGLNQQVVMQTGTGYGVTACDCICIGAIRFVTPVGFHNGAIDEAQIHTTVRDFPWRNTEYAAITAPGSFLTQGTEEDN